MLRYYLRARLWLDDRGAITTETAIVTGVLAILAAGLTVLIEPKIGEWVEAIPSP